MLVRSLCDAAGENWEFGMYFGLLIRRLPPKEIVGMLPETLHVNDSGEVGISKMFSYASWSSISWLRSAMLMQLVNAIGDRVEECLEQKSGRRPGAAARGTHSLAFAEVEAKDLQ